MCEFCKRFDFAASRAVVDKYNARIENAICNTRFPVEQWFNFCPVCGEKLKGNVVNTKWISLKEQWPPKDSCVLAYRGACIGDMMDVYYYNGEDVWEDTYGHWNNAEDEGITHWMHLPEPPKEI